MKIGVVINPYIDDAKEVFEQIKNIISHTGHELVYFMQNHTIRDVDFVLACGGDGTVLGTARNCGEIPIFPLNLGHLGFLTNGQLVIEDLAWIFHMMAANEYVIDKRKRLNANIKAKIEFVNNDVTALNDIVIKAATAKTIKLTLIIDGKLVGDFPADGLLVSTATGSTGYNLSAGGPIIQPHIPVNVITPICSHMLSVRSILASEEQIIRIVIGQTYEEVKLSADGQEDYILGSRDIVDITTSKQTTNIIRLADPNFFNTLSNKMGWGE